MASWYKEGTNVPEKELKESGGFKKKDPSRFWQREGDKSEIIFLDDIGFRVLEHVHPGLHEKYVHLTCSADLPEGCFPCDKKLNRFLQVYFTIWNCKEFEGNDGNMVQGFKQFLSIGKQQIGRIELWKERLGTLVNQKFIFYRTVGGKSSVGDEWEHLGEIDPLDLAYENREGELMLQQPYDYKKLLWPKTKAEVIAMIGENPSPGGKRKAANGATRRAGNPQVINKNRPGADKQLRPQGSEEAPVAFGVDLAGTDDVPF